MHTRGQVHDACLNMSGMKQTHVVKTPIRTYTPMWQKHRMAEDVTKFSMKTYVCMYVMQKKKTHSHSIVNTVGS